MIPVKNKIALTFGQSGTFILIGRSLARFNRYRAYANEAHVETKKILAYAGGNLFAIYLKLIIIPTTPPDVTYRIVVLSLDDYHSNYYVTTMCYVSIKCSSFPFNFSFGVDN